MQTSHKIRLNPNNQQITYFKKACGTARFVWNWGLAQWQQQYQQGNKPNAFSLKKQFNSIKKVEFPWVYEITKYAAQQPFINLGKAFKRFFKKQSAYPKFKKKGVSDSFYIGGDKIKVEGKKIWIPNLGWVRMREALRFGGKVNSVTVSRRADHWYVSINVDVEVCPLPCENQAKVGIDLGIKTLATLSNGEQIQGSKPLKNLLRKLKRVQRQLSKKAKGSNCYQKAKLRLARLHERIANIRQDGLHKLTTYIIDNFQYIAILNLNVRGMMRNRKLSRAIADMGFYEFKRQLMYKADWHQNHVIVASQWFASSKICSCCKHKKQTLSLSERVYICGSCGYDLDRDLNAAINLEQLFNVSCTVSSTGTYDGGQDGDVLAYYAPTQPAWLKP